TLTARRDERLQPEGAGQMSHDLIRAYIELAADGRDGSIGNGQQDDVHTIERRWIEAARPPPRSEHLDAAARQFFEKRRPDRARAQHGSRAQRFKKKFFFPHHVSRRNSTPASPAQASS